MDDLKTLQSKYISYLLRHHPEDGNLVLDRNGWCDTNALIKALQKENKDFSLEDLISIVDTDSKQRYSFNEDKSLIRANQGHSTTQVNVEFKEVIPPDVLYHGTAKRFLEPIYKEGLKPMERQYVHLSRDYETAVKVGKRHGSVAVIKINCKKMVENGIKFYLSENGVYLTKKVLPKYFL